MSHVYPKKYDSSDDMPNGIYAGLGYVYIIGKSPAGPIKVGIARNARKRVKEIECMNGERFKLIWVSSQCSNYVALEIELHERFRKYRTVGEWFYLPFVVAIEAARQHTYKGLSRRKRIDALRDAAERVKPVSAA